MLVVSMMACLSEFMYAYKGVCVCACVCVYAIYVFLCAHVCDARVNVDCLLQALSSF